MGMAERVPRTQLRRFIVRSVTFGGVLVAASWIAFAWFGTLVGVIVGLQSISFIGGAVLGLTRISRLTGCTKGEAVALVVKNPDRVDRWANNMFGGHWGQDWFIGLEPQLKAWRTVDVVLPADRKTAQALSGRPVTIWGSLEVGRRVWVESDRLSFLAKVVTQPATATTDPSSEESVA